MAKKRGPKTLASKGLKPKVSISITIPAELHDMIIALIGELADNKSAVVVSLLKKAFMWKKERQALLEMTRLLDEHPEGYEGPCLCKLCCSYG
jgi:hypothetical protein